LLNRIAEALVQTRAAGKAKPVFIVLAPRTLARHQYGSAQDPGMGSQTCRRGEDRL